MLLNERCLTSGEGADPPRLACPGKSSWASIILEFVGTPRFPVQNGKRCATLSYGLVISRHSFLKTKLNPQALSNGVCMCILFNKN